MKEFIKRIRHELIDIYPPREIDAIIRILALDMLNINATTFYLRDNITLFDKEELLLSDAIKRLKKNEPIQYILGEAIFCGLTFKLNPSVLIPRPETSELVKWITEENKNKKCNILDIGTGSGCIAISLNKLIPNSNVTAWDISSDAIEIAQKNNIINNTNVTFEIHDLFDKCNKKECYDIIVSNPPYIKEEEKKQMEENVLKWEPHLALFVPNESPLLFYREIAIQSLQLLKKNGLLYFEINREYGKEICQILNELGYNNIELRKDFAENDRMIKANI